MKKICALLCCAVLVIGIVTGGAVLSTTYSGYAETKASTTQYYLQEYEPIVISAGSASVVEVSVTDPNTELTQTYPTQVSGGIGALDVEGAGAEFFVNVPADGIYNIRLMSGNVIDDMNYVQVYIDNVQTASLYLEQNSDSWTSGGYCHNNYVYLTKGNHTIKLLRYTGFMYWLSLKVEYIAETGDYLDLTQNNVTGNAEIKQTKLGAQGNAISGFSAGDSVTFKFKAEYAGDYNFAFVYGSSEKVSVNVSVNSSSAKKFELPAMSKTGIETGGIHCSNANLTLSFNEGDNSVTISLLEQASDFILDSVVYWISEYADSDNDGLNDYLEKIFGTDPYQKDTNNTGVEDGDKDFDGDGLSNLYELQNGTDPTVADTDKDGIVDGDEVNVYHTNPLVADTDGDGLSDGDEIVAGCDPLKHDTDGDGLSDGDEIVAGCDPLKHDTDGDGLSDYQEVILFETNPLKADSDDDGLSDYDEIYVYHTNPNSADTDGDGLSDIKEIRKHKTDPLKAKSQAFGKNDKQYIVLKTIFIIGGCLIGVGAIIAGVLLFLRTKKKKGGSSDEKNSD